MGGRKRKQEMIQTGSASFQDIRWEVLVTASGMHIVHPTRGTVCMKALTWLSKDIWYSMFWKAAMKDCEVRLWMVGHIVADGKDDLPLCYWITMNNLSEVLQSLEIPSTTPLWKQHSISLPSTRRVKQPQLFLEAILPEPWKLMRFLSAKEYKKI